MRLFWHDFHPLWFRSGFYDANLLFFSIGTITSYNGTLTNMGEWTCCMYPVTTYGGRILSFTTSIHRFFFLVFFFSPLPFLYSFQRVSDTNTGKKPDTLVVTHLFFHVKQKKTCMKLVQKSVAINLESYVNKTEILVFF